MLFNINTDLGSLQIILLLFPFGLFCSTITTYEPQQVVFDDTTSRFVTNSGYAVESIVTLSNLTNSLSSNAIVTLQIWFTHTLNGDMTIRLYAPDGTYISITDRDGSLYDNVFDGTLFTDSAPNSVSSYPYSGNGVVTPLKPRDPFTNLIGKNPNGQWKVWFYDNAAGDDGNVNHVLLTIKGN